MPGANDERLRTLAALLDAIDDMELSDPRFDEAVAQGCLLEASLSAEDRAEVDRIRSEASAKRSREDLIRRIRRFRDTERTARIQQICFRVGAAIGSSLLGGTR